MKFYHGSIVPNLKTLHPFNTGNSLSDKECVYLTAKKELALLYIWVRKYRWLTYGFNQDNKVVFMETHKDALKEFYKDVKGYIYTVELENEQDNDTDIRSAVTIYNPVDVKDYETIDDVYEKILEYERKGEIIIKHFEDLTDEENEKNKQMILRELNQKEVYQNDMALLGFIKMKFSHVYEEYMRGRGEDSPYNIWEHFE